MMGEFTEAKRLSEPALKDARVRGDLYAAIMNGAYVRANCLAADDVVGARGFARELTSDGRPMSLTSLQLHALWGETCIDLYCGEGRA